MRPGELILDMVHVAAPTVSATATIGITDMRDVAAAFSYLAAGACTIWIAWHKTRPAKETKLVHAHNQAVLCRDCREGAQPPVCPVKTCYRPSDCPLNK